MPHMHNKVTTLLRINYFKMIVSQRSQPGSTKLTSHLSSSTKLAVDVGGVSLAEGR